MDKIRRRQFIKGGAAGTLALGALAAGASPASADEGRGRGILLHFHGVLHGVGATAATATLAISMDVAGRRGDLAGGGWDSGTTANTGMVPGAGPTSTDPSGHAGPVGACYYTAAGALAGDVVTLQGRSLVTNRAWPGTADSEDPQKADTRADGREMNATANLHTGAITFSLSPAGGSFAGTGTVVVFRGGRAAKDDD
jgi:hypothetical protein